MKNAIYWVLGIIGTAILSGMIGFIVPKALGLFGAMPNNMPAGSLAIEIAIVLFPCTLIIKLVIWSRQTIENVEKSARITYEKVIAESLSLSVEDTVTGMLVPEFGKLGEAKREHLDIIRAYISRVADLHPHLQHAAACLARLHQNQLLHDMENLRHRTLRVSHDVDMDISRSLARQANSFLFIWRIWWNPDEWITDWKVYLEELSKKEAKREVVLLVSKEAIINSKDTATKLLKSMGTLKFTVYWCEPRLVDQDMSGLVPETPDIEMIGDMLKLVKPDGDNYLVGKHVFLTVRPYGKDDPLYRYIRSVLSRRCKFTAQTLKELSEATKTTESLSQNSIENSK